MNEVFDTELQGRQHRPVELRRQPSAAGGHATQLAWRPPAGGTWQPGSRSPRSSTTRGRGRQRRAFGRYLDAQPVLVDVVLARQAIAGAERRAAHAARRAAHCLGGHVRPGAGSHRRGDRLRGMGRHARGGDGAGGCREGGAGAGSRPPRRRADGGHHQPLDAVVGGRELDRRQRAYCNFNEGLGKVLRFGANGPEVRRTAAVDGYRVVRGVEGRRRPPRRPRTQAADGAGATHGRRGPQPQRGRDRAVAQAADPALLDTGEPLDRCAA